MTETTHPPGTDEFAKFVQMVNFLYEGSKSGNLPEPRCATIQCPSSSLARKLRRRLYYLREQTQGELRSRADKLGFKLNGTTVVVELMPEWQPEFKGSEAPQENKP
jgi:hypothetical protein